MKISPQYRNHTRINSENYNEVKPIEIDLSIGRWNILPTLEEDYGEFGIEGGEISGLPIFPGRNIQADVIYDGEIGCVDEEPSSPFDETISYPVRNPLFHSENMENLGNGNYRFKTNYFPQGDFTLPTLDEARDFEKRQPKINILEKAFGKESSRNLMNPDLTMNMRCVLGQIFNEIISADERGTDDRREGYYDFEELLGEYINQKEINGDCKAISTFTAGILDALGLKSRIIDGSVMYENLSIEMGHVWSEVYMPLSENEGHWMPIDPAMGTFLSFPEWEDTYHFDRIKLPSFKDQSVKETKLKISYI